MVRELLDEEIGRGKRRRGEEDEIGEKMDKMARIESVERLEEGGRDPGEETDEEEGYDEYTYSQEEYDQLLQEIENVSTHKANSALWRSSLANSALWAASVHTAS